MGEDFGFLEEGVVSSEVLRLRLRLLLLGGLEVLGLGERHLGCRETLEERLVSPHRDVSIMCSRIRYTPSRYKPLVPVCGRRLGTTLRPRRPTHLGRGAKEPLLQGGCCRGRLSEG